MITADLDSELAAAIRTLIRRGALPAAAGQIALTGTWRPGQHGDPATYATAAPFAIAGRSGLDPVQIAAAIARSVSAADWIEAAGSTGAGYLTITVTHRALALSAARMAAAGPGCATSVILRNTLSTSWLWPDLAAARSWQHAWRLQADAMISHLALAAGASPAVPSGRERASTPAPPHHGTRSPVADAVAYFGSASVRYRLGRTMPGGQPWPVSPARLMRPGSHLADPLYPVQEAHAAAASTLRWAGALGLEPAGPAEWLGRRLSAPSERALLSQLSFLPVRVAAAARRHRPDELPHYLEQVSTAWLACRLQAPALPFGGRPAAADPEVSSARLVLAAAVAAVLAAGLALTGIDARDRL